MGEGATAVTRTTTSLRAAAGMLLVFVLAAGLQGCPGSSGLDADGVATNNRGVALMGGFDYDAARAEFESLAGRYPDHPDVAVNLAIATLNRQKEGDEERALELLEGVLAQHPRHARALYCAGLLKLYAGRSEEALADFSTVAEIDPEDANAAYFVGQCLMQLSRYDEALQWFGKCVELDPYLRSAYYTTFQVHQRLRDRDAAMAMLQRFQQLDGNPRARVVEYKYTKMGAKGEVMAIDQPRPKAAPRPDGPVFAAPEALPVDAGSVAWREPTDGAGASITACDINQDGLVDLFIADALAAEQPGAAQNAVLLAADNGYRLVPDHPLASVDAVRTVLWGDLDNDGFTDAYLCRRGPNQLWRQSEGDAWLEVSEQSGSAGGDADTVDGAVLDADHDGDLDLFLVNADGPNELLNNNRDGTFRPLAEQSGLGGPASGSRLVVAADLDQDLDADLIVINRTPPHQVYRNDLAWQYEPAAGWDRFVASEIVAAAAADLDADGRVEIFTVGEDGAVQRWQQGDDRSWHADAVKTSKLSSSAGLSRVEIADLDGDGRLDLLASSPSGWSVATAAEALPEPMLAEGFPANPRCWALVAELPAAGPSLVAWAGATPPQRLGPGGGRFSFVALSLSGKEDNAASMRSNASGIGTRVALRTGSRWTVAFTPGQSSGPGQSLQPLQLGLGGAARADFVALDWSDGVFQTELDLEPGQVQRIAEIQRQLSSCPVLFAWDGARYRFVTDLLGVGGMGYALGPPGEYAEPRPRENVLLPAGLLQAREGRLVLKLAEPMEEVTYLDAIRLVAYDLPPGWSMTLDERMAINGPEPSGAPVFYRRQVLPEAASNDRGNDVIDLVTDADLRAAPVGRLDHRFIGRLAGEHVLTLDFGVPLDSGPGRPVLVADGWVEYPYSSTGFAAWQAGAAYLAPTLSALGSDGMWRVVLEQLGYPAGMPRQMSLPLDHLPPGTTRLRLATNQEIYWDRLAVAYSEPCPGVVRAGLALLEARLEHSGFQHRSTLQQRLPAYDYNRRRPLWDTRFPEGNYTRFGQVEALVAARDDAVAIFGPGEEIHLEYAAPAEPPLPGWTRAYVLETEGWCKDMDLYTRDNRTVGPLPSSGRNGATRERLHKEHNTRYVWGAR